MSTAIFKGGTFKMSVALKGFETSMWGDGDYSQLKINEPPDPFIEAARERLHPKAEIDTPYGFLYERDGWATPTGSRDVVRILDGSRADTFYVLATAGEQFCHDPYLTVRSDDTEGHNPAMKILPGHAGASEFRWRLEATLWLEGAPVACEERLRISR